MLRCAAVLTLVSTAYDYLSISFVHTSSFEAQPLMALGYAIGNGIAIIGIVPLVLLVYLDIRRRGFSPQMRHVAESALLLDLVVFAATPIAALLPLFCSPKMWK